MSGYDITKAFNQSLAFFWSAQTSQVYREIETMTAKRWIEVKEERQRGHMVATVYAITAEGREELMSWLRQPLEERERERNPFLLRLFFQSMAGPESMRLLVGQFKERAEASAALLRETLDTVIPERHRSVQDDLATFCWSQAAAAGLAHYEAEARWAEDCLAQLEVLNGGKS
jgi:DNA-binding PadR family transcriptional regulator